VEVRDFRSSRAIILSGGKSDFQSPRTEFSMIEKASLDRIERNYEHKGKVHELTRS